MATDKTILSDDVFKDVGAQLKNKNLKKIMKKMQNDPRVFELINKLQKQLSSTNTKVDTNTTPRERVKERIRQCRLQRGGKMLQQHESEKNEKNEKPEENVEQKLETVVKTQVQDTVTSTISDVKKQKKKQNDKLKKLKKKYGVITLEQYTESLKKISDSSLVIGEINHHRNIVELYVKQSNIAQEKTLDDTSDNENSLSDDEIVDIESK
jgi:hypothetical protein